MKAPLRIALIAATTVGLVGAFSAAADAAPPRPGPPAQGAVFVQTDNPAGNAIAAFSRSSTGALTPAGTYATGGDGGVLGGSAVDHTASEGSLNLSGGSLFAVNAGSNTITSFAVVGDRLIRRQIVGSGGDFPVSIAVHGDLLYVLNARDGGSIQGYLDEGGLLRAIPGWNRRLGLNPDATPEFTSTPAQIAFTPDGTRLVVTTKAGGDSIDVFGLRGIAGPSATPVTTVIPGSVPFGFTFDRGGNLVVTEAGPNAVATFRIEPNGSARALAQSPTGQSATCWIVADGSELYASNAGSATLSAFADGGNGALVPEARTATDPGTVDAAATPDGRHLYAQTGGTGTVDEFSVGAGGSLTRIGSVLVPNAAGGEGIVAF